MCFLWTSIVINDGVETMNGTWPVYMNLIYNLVKKTEIKWEKFDDGQAASR